MKFFLVVSIIAISLNCNSQVLVKDINIGATGSIPQSDLKNIDDTLYFSATDGINGSEFWKSDGSTSGTNMFYNINTNGIFSSIVDAFMLTLLYWLIILTVPIIFSCFTFTGVNE